MSIRKSPQPTPPLLAAARRNTQHSTGPRSPSPSRTPSSTPWTVCDRGSVVGGGRTGYRIQDTGFRSQEAEGPGTG
jgi:hypothetical protein